MTEVRIERLGHKGEGIAILEGRPVFVPFALPGETIAADFSKDFSGDRARDIRILEASPDRVEPPCPLFQRCGGCSLQHLAVRPYAAFKRQLVVEALADRGLRPEVAETILVPAASRRRATFAGLMKGHEAEVGFNERSSHRIVPLSACAVLCPDLLAALPALAALTIVLAPRKSAIDLTVTATETGLDVAISAVIPREVDRLRMRLIAVAADYDLARLTAGGELLVERRTPIVLIDGVPVTPPPGGFLQASRQAEEKMKERVVAAAAGAKRVADLYSGVGTFALPLARTASVYAAEASAPAVAALDRAARRMSGRRALTVERRDLSRRPLVEKELEGFDAVVLDPPRAGAPEQSAFLSRSRVRTVIAVSCNPATLARDLRQMVDGGYSIKQVTPIDQFLWSSHVEVVAVLTRS